jgi:hypothetical protein
MDKGTIVMTNAEFWASIPSVVTSIIALVTFVTTLVTAWRVKRAAEKSAMAASKAEEKLDSVHVLVNSNLSQVRSDLAQAQVKIDKLQQLVVDLVAKAKPLDDHEQTVIIDKMLSDKQAEKTV